MPPLCKEIELNCFSTVLHPPPSPSGHGPITMHKVQIVCLPPRLHHLPAKERHNISAFQKKKKKKHRLNPSYSWIWWSRKTTSHLNLMTRDGSCHGAPVQFCKSHCKSESVHKAQYTAWPLTEGHDVKISKRSAVTTTPKDKHKPLTSSNQIKQA